MSTFLGNPQDWEVYESLHAFNAIPTASSLLPNVISTLALLVLGYYALNFFALWPETIQRSLYEIAIYLVPSPVIYAMQSYSAPFANDEASFKRSDFGNQHAKAIAIKRLLGRAQLPSALRKARNKSGLNTLLSATKELGPPGLGNWDNSCYQNSILQALASLPAFRGYIEKSRHQSQNLQIAAPTHGALGPFLQLLSDASATRSTIWTPNILKSMDSWQQQDAQEYFTRIADSLEKEYMKCFEMLKKRSRAGLNAAHDPSAVKSVELVRRVSLGETPVSPPNSRTSTVSIEDEELLASMTRTPMDGLTAQAVECLTCGFSEGYSLTQFNCITLNLGVGASSHLEDLIEEYTNDEHIEGVECTECTKAVANSNGQGQDSTDDDGPSPTKRPKLKPVRRTKVKQITIARLPKNLVFHINRSVFNEYGEQRKNGSFIHFPARLDFLSRWCPPLDKDTPSIQRTYELKCSVTHYGRHDNGHYVALGKRDKDWYCFNDEVVSKISEEEVLARGNVFMLFYEAVESPLAPIPNEHVVAAAPESEREIIDLTSPDVVREPQVENEVIDVGPVVDTSGPESSSSSSESESPGDEPQRAVAPVPVLRTASGSTRSDTARELSPAVRAL